MPFYVCGAESNSRGSSFMKRLVHNGIRIIELPTPTGMTLTVRGNPIVLNALQEQMMMAFVAKRHLGYWEDRVFVRNF